MELSGLGLLAHLSLLKERNESAGRDTVPVHFSYILKLNPVAIKGYKIIMTYLHSLQENSID